MRKMQRVRIAWTSPRCLTDALPSLHSMLFVSHASPAFHTSPSNSFAYSSQPPPTASPLTRHSPILCPITPHLLHSSPFSYRSPSSLRLHIAEVLVGIRISINMISFTQKASNVGGGEGRRDAPPPKKKSEKLL